MRCPGSIEVSKKSRKNGVTWVWRPLDARFLKVNVDGSFLENSTKGGIEDLIRDRRVMFYYSFVKGRRRIWWFMWRYWH